MGAPSPSFQCLFCGAAEAQPFLLRCRDLYMGKPGEFDYYRCSACGLVQLSPIPADLGAYYEGYQVHRKKSWLHELMRRLLMTGGYYYPPRTVRPQRILDFGCGDGWYIREAKRQGHALTGYEPEVAHAARLSIDLGVPVYSDQAALEQEQAGRFDIVTMHFVVEHVSDLAATFDFAARMLKPGGLFYFVIPNLESIDFKMFGRLWHGFDPPRHLSFPTPPLIARLAENSGFTVEKTRAFGTPNDMAGNLSNLVAGRFRYPVFCAFIPIAILWARFFSRCNLAAELRRK